MKTFILALNHHEAKNFIRKNPNDYIILNRVEQLFGTVNPVVYITERAYMRPDYNDFMDVIKMRNGIRLSKVK